MASRFNVMGIDIAKGSPLSSTSRPLYAVVVIDSDGRVIYETNEAPLKRVIRIAWEYHVKRIGVDNVFELAENSRQIAKLLSLLPSDIELYQVTVDKGTFVDLKSQALKLGIELHSKPPPLQTAYINALLALKGIGTPIRAVEYRTRIIVSRGRSVGSGGSSANRYVRGMRTAILQVVRNIRDALDKAGINYDLILRRSAGGLDSAVFIVYAPRSALNDIVKPVRGHDVRIVIRPEYRAVLFLDNSGKVTSRRYVIVGVDPGIETGIAILDLSSRLLFLESSKDLDRARIANLIYSIGIPVIIACDKNPPPETVKKLCASLGAQLYVPPKSLSVAEKEQLIEWFRKRSGQNIRVETTHIRDALAAAIKAFKHYEKKFNEIERKIAELGIDVDVDELKVLLIKGESISQVIEYALDQYLEEEFREPYSKDTEAILKKFLREDSTSCRDRVKELEEKLQSVLREKELLREEVQNLRKKLEELEFELRYTSRPSEDLEVLIKRATEELRDRLKILRNHLYEVEQELIRNRNIISKFGTLLRDIALSRLRVVPYVKRLSNSSISSIEDLLRETSIVVVEQDAIDLDVLDKLSKLGVVVIFESCRNKDIIDILADKEIPVYCGIDVVEKFDDVVLIENSVLDEKIRLAKSIVENKRIEKMKRQTLDKDKLLQIIREYRESILNTTRDEQEDYSKNDELE